VPPLGPGEAHVEPLVILGRGGVGGATAGAVADLEEALALENEDDDVEADPEGAPFC